MDSRYGACLYYEVDGQKMALFIVIQHLSRLMIESDARDHFLRRQNDIIIWPIAEVPEADVVQNRYAEPICPVDIFSIYRASVDTVVRRFFIEGVPHWHEEMMTRYIAPPRGDGRPLPAISVSAVAKAMALNFIELYAGRNEPVKYGPDIVPLAESKDIMKGPPLELLKRLDPPVSASRDPVSREIFIIQSEDGSAALFVRGYAWIGIGSMFELFTPVLELKPTEFGRNHVERFEVIRSQIGYYGAVSARWVVKNQHGEWHSALICKQPPKRDKSATPIELKETLPSVEDYLAWRASAYKQEIKLAVYGAPNAAAYMTFLPLDG